MRRWVQRVAVAATAAGAAVMTEVLSPVALLTMGVVLFLPAITFIAPDPPAQGSEGKTS